MEFISSITLLALILTVTYFLYIEGLCTTDMKIALLDLTSFGGKRSRFSRCRGYMKRIVKVKTDKTYRFSFDLDLTRGDVTVQLFSPDGEMLLSLDKSTPYADIELSAGVRYRMTIRFYSASGSYKLNWE